MATKVGRDVYIVGCVRTPIGRGREGGALHEVHPVHLLANTLRALTDSTGVDKKYVEDVVCGCVTPIGKQGSNIGRLAVLQAGFPVHVPGIQINRMCGSGQQAVHFAAQAIASGDMDLAIACGVEMMGTVKMGSDAPPGLFNKEKNDLAASFPYKFYHQGVSADMLAKKYGISRQQCDEFSALSHQRAHAAITKGYFKSQIKPVEVKSADGNKTTVTTDECVRYPADAAKMAQLPLVFTPDGVVTAGNSSQVSDGASAILLCSGKKADELGLKKRARIVARVAVGSDPEMMLDGVIPATQLVLKKAGLRIEDIDVFEINEAFAPVVLAWQKVLKIDPKRVNPNGGAIAHGHPLGATGCILMTKLVNELERTGGRYGLQTMCIGHGQATATIIENLSAPIKSKL